MRKLRNLIFALPFLILIGLANASIVEVSSDPEEPITVNPPELVYKEGEHVEFTAEEQIIVTLKDTETEETFTRTYVLENFVMLEPENPEDAGKLGFLKDKPSMNKIEWWPPTDMLPDDVKIVEAMYKPKPGAGTGGRALPEVYRFGEVDYLNLNVAIENLEEFRYVPKGEDIIVKAKVVDGNANSYSGRKVYFKIENVTDWQYSETEGSGAVATSVFYDNELELEPGDYKVVVMIKKPTAEGYKEVTTAESPGSRDEADCTVFEIDLATDSNNDGSINYGETIDDAFAPGVIVCLDRKGDGANLDDFAVIKLNIEPDLSEGTLTLEASSGGSRIKVWEEQSKTTQVVLPKAYDLSVADFPKTLYVDGIQKGQVFLDLYYEDPGNTELLRDRVAVYVTETISWSPAKGDVALVWRSTAASYLGEADAVMFVEQIEKQGFKVEWYQDEWDPYDPGGKVDFGACTLENYKNMRNSGMFYVVSHGEPGAHLAVYAEDSPAGKDACDNWRGTEPNMETEHEYGYGYMVRVSSKWLADNWASTLNTNKAIGFWAICYSATGNPDKGELSVKEAAGGRWRVGFRCVTWESEALAVAEKFLKRMNGTWPTNAEGTRRTAGKAYDGGTEYTGNVQMDGNDWTTLCPAPNAVFPDSPAGSRKGSGCIIFDTYMRDEISANEAVIRQSGSPTVSARRWFGNDSGKYGVSFDFDKTEGGSLTMRAVAEKCRNKDPNGGRALDGDRKAPNEDDCDWSF